jgi:hypothetical protein
MKKSAWFWMVLVLAAALFAVPESDAQGRTVPVQLSLYSPAQVFPEDTDVVGLRLNLIRGVNNHVSGIDIGLWNRAYGDETAFQLGGLNVVDGHYGGIQLGVANLVGETFTGWQGGLFNMTRGESGMLQSGAMNLALSGLRGVQLGFVNYAQDISGLQIGVFNACQVMYGVQIGLVNIISDKNILPVLPIVNAAF